VPTARELLEQADALMRKNRGRIGSDIPVLTDAIAASPSQLPVPAADIPVLTESVVEGVVSVPPPGPTPAVAAMFEGDPSDWLVMDTIDPALHSITGGAPDTLAVLPPVTLKAPELASEVPPVEPETLTRATHKAAGSAPTPPPARSNAPEPIAPPAAVEYVPPPDVVEYVPPPAVVEYMPPPAVVEYMPPPAVVEYMPPPAVVEYMPPAAVEHVPALVVAEYVQPTATSAPGVNVHTDADAEPATVSDERWRALAEQISMQVLQRIDLFTDTGLKEQLARHLQPIVDRASAELVGEINDQVGKLVRSYIAEAIEREIAQWRSEQR
jgi:hypothetical protein